MKVSYQWLKDYCAFDLPCDELADQLRSRGMPAESVTPVGDDFCLDLEITANRPDLLSHIGVAREISAFTGVPLHLPSVELREEAASVASLARVEVQHPDLCPRYTARVLRKVRVGPAPAEMQRRLEAVGLRPVNNIVDITNYVLMECGQPQHAFDFDRLRGCVVTIRPAVRGEKLELIDASEIDLAPEHLVIADVERPVALAGIMGGLATEITESTGNVLLESAKFDPVNIRRTTRTTGKSSDSSYRFERGVDTPTVEWASRRAAALIQEHAGANVAAGVIDIDFTIKEARSVALRVPRIERVLGVAVSAAEAGRLLKGIGFGVKLEGHDVLTVAVPSFRPDVEREIDLIEEVARCYGYDRVPAVSKLPITDVASTRFDRVCVAARHTLIRLGYHEAVTTSFLSDELAATFSPWSSEAPLRVRNPLRADEATLRRSLVPCLLQVARTNQDRGVDSVRLFELNRVYVRRPGAHVLPEEKSCLAILGGDDCRAVRGSAEAVLEQFGLAKRAHFGPVTHAFLTPGTGAAWRVGNSLMGYMGEIDDAAAAPFRLRTSVCVAELDADTIAALAALERRFTGLPRFPAVNRDVALVVPEAATWQQIVDTVRGAGAEHIEEIRFGETYRGKQVEAGKKSVFFSITYRSPERTLTNEEVNASQERIVAALAEHLGASLRS